MLIQQMPFTAAERMQNERHRKVFEAMEHAQMINPLTFTVQYIRHHEIKRTKDETKQE